MSNKANPIPDRDFQQALKDRRKSMKRARKDQQRGQKNVSQKERTDNIKGGQHGGR